MEEKERYSPMIQPEKAVAHVYKDKRKEQKTQPLVLAKKGNLMKPDKHTD
jgi:hypothetical protein